MDASSNAIIRTVILEDDPTFREFLEAFVSFSHAAKVVGSFETVRNLLCEQELRPDLLLIDLGLPEITGLEAIPMLRARFPQAKMVVMTANENGEAVLEAFRGGACGYILKDCPATELLDCLNRVLHGDTVVSSRALKELLSALRSGPEGMETLTSREHETLQLLCSGQSYKQAAHTMGVSINTIRTHVRALYRKLGVRSIIEASNKCTAAAPPSAVQPASKDT